MNVRGDGFALIEGDCVATLKRFADNRFDAVVTDPPYEVGFMNKAWDRTGISFSVDLWREVLRTLKPGGHVLSFGASRSYHRMTCAIEDAGFEIRDSLHWFYGTGFPKSLNVENELRDRADNEADAEIATRYAGVGTALKPAHEPIVLARKPLIGTVAANVLAFGTGGIRIDDCRIGTSKSVPSSSSAGGQRGRYSPIGADREGTSGFDSNVGRWPANVILDEDAAAELDAQTGELPKAGSIGANTAAAAAARVSQVAYGDHDAPRGAWAAHGDSGGASRFFYVAKPTRGERDIGCEDLPPRTGGEATDREDGSAGVENPRAGAGRTGGARNYHPTVKPVSLMRYLVRLITPPGGTVLDPFTGSGTTGMGARLESRPFVGIEREPDFVEISRRRISAAHRLLERAT